MAIEINPFTVTCTECSFTRPISRFNARSPEAMVIFANSISKTHVCRIHNPVKVETTDLWSARVKFYESRQSRLN